MSLSWLGLCDVICEGFVGLVEDCESGREEGFEVVMLAN
jgi:hypothetical protein